MKMELAEAKQELIEHGYIISEDTETLDDEINDYLSNKNRTIKDVKKADKVYDKIRNSSLEKKTLNAVNFNIKSFLTGLEEKFDAYFENYTVDHMYYDTKQNFQPTSYWFDDDNLEFQVDYWDEKGYIDLGLIDIKKGTRKNKKFKITKIDENIEEVFNWFRAKTENYDQSEW